jgi:membrane associated rhomboid family serine protease
MNIEQKNILKSFYVPVLFVAVLWAIKIMEVVSGVDLREYGVLPRHLEGLSGILTMPFIHANYKHLISNSVPLIVLGSSLVYFYRESALKTFLLIYFLHSLWLWMGGRESYHIGASGIVYGLAAFLFFSGIIRRHKRLMAISMLVVFLYGGMLWGIFPLFIGVSWEAHLGGSIAGILCAWVFRKEGLQKPVYEWEDEDDSETEGETETETEGEAVAGAVAVAGAGMETEGEGVAGAAAVAEAGAGERTRGETRSEIETEISVEDGVDQQSPVIGMPVVVRYDFKPKNEDNITEEDDKN